MTARTATAAAAAQLAGRPLAYVVTAKGSAATGDTLRTFRPHLGWAAIAGGCLLTGRLLGHDYPSLYLWAGLTLIICIAPVVQLFAGRLPRPSSLRSTARAPRVAQSYPVPTQRRIGDILIRHGLITSDQLDTLLDLQATSDNAWQRLGDLAVEQGYVSADQLEAAIRLERPAATTGSMPRQRAPQPRHDDARRP